MNPQNPAPQTQPGPDPRIRNPLEVMQPGEQIICEIKRHPIGMFGMYIAAGFLLLALAVVTFVVLPSVFTGDHSSITAIGALVFVLLASVVIAFVFVANKVYWGNSWVVSSDSLTQISRTSLFSKQSSQLSLGNLEDVTSAQRGILAQMFKFGTLRAETAGERSKFVFPYCPNPNYYAQKILVAREAFEMAHHGGKQEPFKPADATYPDPAFQQAQPPQPPQPSQPPQPPAQQNDNPLQ